MKILSYQILLFCLVMNNCVSILAQNVGIGTITPQTKLTVNGAISSIPNTSIAANTITIPDNVSVFWISNVAGVQNNLLYVINGYEGQYLTIYNNDDNEATFAGHTITEINGVATFTYINHDWRLCGYAPIIDKGTLDYSYDYGGIGVGRTIVADAGAVLIEGADGFQSTGTLGIGTNLSLSGIGTRMFWYPKKAAFRAGYVNGIQWNDDSIGIVSFATGYGTKASSNYTTAMGYNTQATKDYATAMGINTEAKGIASTALGNATIATGHSAFAAGEFTEAIGYSSFAMGRYCKATGGHSIAMGYESEATANYSTSIGLETKSTGIRSFSTNYKSEANGQYSIAMGDRSIVNGNYSIAMGQLCNTSGGNAVGIGSYTVAAGSNSFAIGTTINANGNQSFAIGHNSSANGEYSTTLGSENFANGNFSITLGRGNQTTGVGAIAMGNGTHAEGAYSTTMGDATHAKDNMCTAIGQEGIAQGWGSTVIGYRTKTYDNYGLAMGTETNVYGRHATAMGLFTRTFSYAETAIGLYNTIYTASSTTGFIDTDRLFVIGNGDADYQRSDAMVILKNGNTTLNGDLTINGDICYTGSIGTCSDRRYKRNIEKLPNALASLNHIQGYTYYYDTEKFVEKKFSTQHQIGVLAQEVESIYPELVTTNNDGYKSVNYSKLTPILLEAIKELASKVEKQAKEIEELKTAIYGKVGK
ncbi:MAG: tail fiber domain-containing protein [Bacteroidia bacterium]